MSLGIRIIGVILLAATFKSTFSLAQDVKLRATLTQERSYISSPHAVALSPDDCLLFSGGISSTDVFVWNTMNNSIEFRLQGHTSPVRCVAYTLGNSVSDAVAGKTGSSATVKTPGKKDIDAKRDGILATGDTAGTIKLWDLVQKKEIATLKGHGQPLFALSFSRDGNELVSVGIGGEVKLWDIASHKIKKDTRLAGAFGIGFGEYELPGTQIYYESVSIGPNARFLAAGTVGYAAPIEIWDLQTGRLQRKLAGHSGFPGRVNRLQFSGDGKTLLSVGHDTVKTWDFASGRPKAILYVPQGRSIDPILFPLLKEPGQVGPAAWSADQKWLALNLGQQIALVETNSRKSKHFFDPGISLAGGRSAGGSAASRIPKGEIIGAGIRNWMAFSTSGRMLVIPHTGKENVVPPHSSGGLSLWNVANAEFTGVVAWGTSLVQGVAFSQNGQLLASVDSNGIVRAWDLKTNQAISSGRAGKALSVGFHDNSKVIWTTANEADSRQTFIHCMDLTNRKIHKVTCEKDASAQGNFSPDGSLLASTNSKEVSLIDVMTGRSIRVLKGSAESLRFADAGKTLVGVDKANKGKLLYWDIGTGVSRNAPPEDDERGLNIASLKWAASPDGKTIARSFEYDSTIFICDAKTMRNWATLPEKGNVHRSVFSPDGRTLAVPGTDGRITLWDIPIRK